MRKKSRLDRHRKGRRLHMRSSSEVKQFLQEKPSESPPRFPDLDAAADVENLPCVSESSCFSPRTNVALSLLKLAGDTPHFAPKKITVSTNTESSQPNVPPLKSTVSTQTDEQTVIGSHSVSTQTDIFFLYVVRKAEVATQTTEDTRPEDAITSMVSSGTELCSSMRSAKHSLTFSCNTIDEGCISSTPEEEPTKSIGIQITSAPLSLFTFQHLPPEKFNFFIGLTKENFEALYVFIGSDKVCTKLKYCRRDGTPRKPIKSSLSPRDRLFMTLLRLRRAYPIVDIAFLFGLSTGWVSSIIYTWIRFLRVQLDTFQEKNFPSAEYQNLHKSAIFKKFPNLRAIIDATEFKIQHPYNFRQQTNTYSTYKSTNTLKYLVAFSCLGGISYVSRGFEGSTSDKHLLKSCGFLKQLRPGDVVMCDRGFDVEAELNAIGVQLVIPPFLAKRAKLSAREAIQSKDISSVRTYIEVAIGRIKFFRLLRGQIPNTLLPVLDDLVFVAAMLTLFDPPFIE